MPRKTPLGYIDGFIHQDTAPHPLACAFEGCTFTCATAIDARKHKLRHDFLVHTCSLCSFFTVYKSSLLKHVRKMHAGNAVTMCACGRRCDEHVA